MWGTIKDYMNSLLGAIFLLASLIFIPEIKRSKKYRRFAIIGVVILVWLGIDNINRNNKKDSINEQRRSSDSTRMHNMDSTIISISNSYKKDTNRYADFKRQLDTDFHIKDSANIPIKRTIINHINRVDYLKQF